MARNLVATDFVNYCIELILEGVIFERGATKIMLSPYIAHRGFSSKLLCKWWWFFWWMLHFIYMIYSNIFLCTSVAYFPRYFGILFIFLNLAFSKGAPFQPVCNWWWLRTQSCLWESYRKDVKKIFLIEKEDTDKKQEVRLPRLRAGGLGQCLITTFCDQIFEQSYGP